MATVFMKWLETSPKDYDRGIQMLTLGCLRRLKHKVVRDYIFDGIRVLEIGCGTGTLTNMMAEAGAVVTGIDSSPVMLAEAERKIESVRLGAGGRVELELMDASQIEDRFPEASFDLIVSTLVFSEMPEEQQRYVLESCLKMLAVEGRLLIADEVIPEVFLQRLLYYLVRLPLALITWLLTRTSTRPLKDFRNTLEGVGFSARIAESSLGGSVVLYEGAPQLAIDNYQLPIVNLSHRVTLQTVLLDIWTLFFRLIPPYPKFQTGLYAVGDPTPKSPVLVTGNFDLTVRRLTRAIDGQIDAWVLVADSAGINVWCAAGGGFFTAEKVIAALKTSQVDQVVDHHALILPQLCANGVDGWKIRRETGWGVHWGPARAEDIPEYLRPPSGSPRNQGERVGKKTDSMRWVRFPLKDRLEMVTVTMAFYGLMILLPFLIFWRHLFWPVTASLMGLSYFYAIVHPWLPGRDGLQKCIPLILIALGGFFLYTTFWNPLPTPSIFNWALGLTGLSVFTAAELQGMSPMMRGEQANWGAEGIIFAMLSLVYWLVPITLNWE